MMVWSAAWAVAQASRAAISRLLTSLVVVILMVLRAALFVMPMYEGGRAQLGPDSLGTACHCTCGALRRPEEWDGSGSSNSSRCPSEQLCALASNFSAATTPKLRHNAA